MKKKNDEMNKIHKKYEETNTIITFIKIIPRDKMNEHHAADKFHSFHYH